MVFKIESGIPIPEARSRLATGLADALRKLEPGQSFLVPYRDGDRSGTQRVITTAASDFKKRREPRRKFVTRCMDDGVRVWRIE